MASPLVPSVTGRNKHPVYMIDFAAYRPPGELAFPMYEAREAAGDRVPTVDFMLRVAEKSGIGPHGTFMPPAINPLVNRGPLKTDMASAMVEAEMVMCGAVQELLERTGIQPHEVDIVVTSCTIFCPTPDLTCMLVNKLGMRSDIQTYALGGMGCSNGVVGMGLIRDLLQARPKSLALFVPAELVTTAYYAGTHKQYAVANSLFRMGGAACLLASKHTCARKAKYQLQFNAHVLTSMDDDAYRCMAWGPDPDGVNGVFLSKSVPKCAAAALTACLKGLAPHIMSGSQWTSAVAHWATGKLASFSPDWAQCVEHFALHAGGYSVLKEVQKGMALPAEAMMPSFATLRDYGNTSCSTTFYTMAYLESVGAGVRRHERVMQVGLGTGVKAGINIWVATRNNRFTHGAWAHLQGQPVTPADLPRPIDEPAASSQPAAEPAQAASAHKAAAAAADSGVDKRVHIHVATSEP